MIDLKPIMSQLCETERILILEHIKIDLLLRDYDCNNSWSLLHWLETCFLTPTDSNPQNIIQRGDL